jgi:hypothetical protein
VLQSIATHLRLKVEEVERIERLQAALSKKMGGASISKAHVLHVLIAKGYEALAAELGIKS